MWVKKLRGLLCVAAVLTGCMGAIAWGQVDSYSLLVQQSPSNAGAVKPGVGVHKIPVGEQIRLQALAKPGYRFLYWLGDVSDSQTDQSVVVLDAPKIVVAVFGRMDYELGTGGGGSAVQEAYVADPYATTEGADELSAPSGGAGANTLTASANYGSKPFASSHPSGRAASRLRRVPLPSGNNGNPGGDNGDPGNGNGGGDDIPVPGDGGDDPAVPEPATLALLGIGALLFLRRSR
mgnify:CR=1 FL=1